MLEMRCFLTEYDQSCFNMRIKEDGVEHCWSRLPESLLNQNHIRWAAMGREVVKTSEWQTLF